ncbi:MAG: hypothetical protein ACTHLW_21375, partial [Verrucomicrobiota bacterium]
MSKPKARTSALNLSARTSKANFNTASPTLPQLTDGESAQAFAERLTGNVNGTPLGSASGNSKSTEIAETVKELIRLAQEQGYLTY